MSDKKTKRGQGPQEVNQTAFSVVQRATAEKPAKTESKPVKGTGLKLGKSNSTCTSQCVGGLAVQNLTESVLFLYVIRIFVQS